MTNLSAELEKQIADRKAQAISRHIREHAIDIATGLGRYNTTREITYTGSEITETWKYDDPIKKVLIIYTRVEGSSSDGGYGGSAIQVFFEEIQVFYSGSDIACYIPGKWEQYLIHELPTALQAILKRNSLKKQEQEKEIIAQETAERLKWGL